MLLRQMEYDVERPLDEGAVLKDQEKNRKDEVRRMTTYYVRREFKGAVTVDHAVKKAIVTHMRQFDR